MVGAKPQMKINGSSRMRVCFPVLPRILSWGVGGHFLKSDSGMERRHQEPRLGSMVRWFGQPNQAILISACYIVEPCH